MSLLVNQFGIETNKVMAQTTLVLFITMCAEISYGLLGLKFHPFKILKAKLVALLSIIPFIMIGFNGLQSPLSLFVTQVVVICLGQGLTPASPIINRSFPVFGRYTYLLFIWAFSHSLMYLLTAYVCEQITSFHVLCLLLFVAASISLIGVHVFVSHEKITVSDSKDAFSSEALQDEKERDALVKKWIKNIGSATNL